MQGKCLRSLKKNTDSNQKIYEVEFTEDCIEEMDEIYNYISNKLVANTAAKKLIKQVKKEVLALEVSPMLYMKIDKKDKFEREYRRMVVKNYVVLYTIDEENKKVYISHMYYGRRNYL